MRRDQPSTATNRNSLSGRDISVGETIIIPIAMRMFETMMSMTKNGRKGGKAISNARVSAELTKAGSRMMKSSSLTFARVAGGQMRAVAERKNSRSPGFA